jgi:NAD(P)-dependent dehydrogenase (short-subunit alcohol dehydrogenase family)
VGLLEGTRALITGGGSGIGKATAARMVAEGAVVAVVDLDESRAKAVADEVGGTGYGCDVGDGEALGAVVNDAAARMGGLDALFNNAGVGALSPLHKYPASEWERVIRVNLTGVYNGLRAAIPLMLEGGGGVVVNNASVAGTQPTRGEAPYAAAKAGVLALTASAALEYGPTVRVNAVSPGMIETRMTAPVFGVGTYAQTIAETTPLQRLGQPEDVADVVVMLCSDLSRFVTGHNLVVDGGLSLPAAGIDPMLRHLLGLLEGHRPE